MDSNHRDAAVWTGENAGEIEAHAARLLQMDLGLAVRTDRGPSAGDVVIGTPASSATMAALAPAWKLDALGPEGFVVEEANLNGMAVQVVVANSPQGVLYGCVALADAVRLGRRREDVRLRERPTFVHRNLWTWSHPSPEEDAFFHFDLIRDVSQLRQHPRFVEFGRYLAQARINAMTFWPAWDGRPDWGDAKPGTFEAYRGLTRWLKDDFGIESYLFAWYEVHQGSKLPILGWPICPFDDEVIQHWRGRLERLAAEVPDLKGIVMAGAGGDWVRGPWECQCWRCRRHGDRDLLLRAMEMIVGDWADRGFKIIWKAVTDRPELVGSEVAHFADIDAELPPYAMVAHKPFYKDFRPVSPLHPLLHVHEDRPVEQAASPPRPYVLEFQIYGEYRGSSAFPCVMADRWGEIAPMAARKGYAGLMAICSLKAKQWDHPLNRANWYAFGRYAWNPFDRAEDVLRDWATLTFGREAAAAVVDVCRKTYQASTKLMFFRGTMTQNHSKLPTIDYELESSLIGPWHNLPKSPDGYIGRGHDVSMYPPAVAEQIRSDPAVRLWAHRVPITPELCDEAIAEKREAWDLVKEMAAAWEAIPHVGWTELHAQISEQFRRNLVDAEVWYEDIRLYFDYKAGRLTRSELARRIADIEARFDPQQGSEMIQETFEPFIREWKRVLAGGTMRRSMEGKYHRPEGEPFLPGLKDEGSEKVTR